MYILTIHYPKSDGASFDFASLSFHVPICGLAPKQAAVAANDTAVSTAAISVFIHARFGQKRR